jgi:hypothetical protein
MASRYKTRFFPLGDHPLFPGKKWVGEHRVVLAEKLGRPLTYDELAHHKDEDPRNNHPDNIELLRRGEHSHHHNAGRTRTEAEREGTSKALRGRPKSPEHVEKVRVAMLGKTHSNATKEALSAMSKGKPKSEQTKNRMRESWGHDRRYLQFLIMQARNDPKEKQRDSTL